MDIWGITYLFMYFGVISYVLWKDNPWFGIARFAALGGIIGCRAAMAFDTLNRIAIVPLSTDWTLIIPLVLGLLLFTRWTKVISYLRRIPLAVQVGAILGVGVVRASTNLGSSIQNIMTTSIIGGNYTPIDNLVLIFVVITTFCYFIFTRGKTGLERVASTSAFETIVRVGRYTIVFTLGIGLSATLTGLWGKSLIGNWKTILSLLGIL